MGHRAGQREGGREAGEGKKAPSLHPCAQPGERKKAERERERERKCLIYVLQWAARPDDGANVVLCEAIFRQREVKKGRGAYYTYRVHKLVRREMNSVEPKPDITLIFTLIFNLISGYQAQVNIFIIR